MKKMKLLTSVAVCVLLLSVGGCEVSDDITDDTILKDDEDLETGEEDYSELDSDNDDGASSEDSSFDKEEAARGIYRAAQSLSTNGISWSALHVETRSDNENASETIYLTNDSSSKLLKGSHLYYSSNTLTKTVYYQEGVEYILDNGQYTMEDSEETLSGNIEKYATDIVNTFVSNDFDTFVLPLYSVTLSGSTYTLTIGDGLYTIIATKPANNYSVSGFSSYVDGEYLYTESSTASQVTSSMSAFSPVDWRDPTNPGELIDKINRKENWTIELDITRWQSEMMIDYTDCVAGTYDRDEVLATCFTDNYKLILNYTEDALLVQAYLEEEFIYGILFVNQSNSTSRVYVTREENSWTYDLTYTSTWQNVCYSFLDVDWMGLGTNSFVYADSGEKDGKAYDRYDIANSNHAYYLSWCLGADFWYDYFPVEASYFLEYDNLYYFTELQEMEIIYHETYWERNAPEDIQKCYFVGIELDAYVKNIGTTEAEYKL